mmetsp:Transcript_24293/g.54135  ORF Transcript_24293/g.54135 Transcript_24293/m.54135 type:complete len:251 (-) Transcript_24293:52-804(-)
MSAYTATVSPARTLVSAAMTPLAKISLPRRTASPQNRSQTMLRWVTGHPSSFRDGQPETRSSIGGSSLSGPVSADRRGFFLVLLVLLLLRASLSPTDLPSSLSSFDGGSSAGTMFITSGKCSSSSTVNCGANDKRDFNSPKTSLRVASIRFTRHVVKAGGRFMESRTRSKCVRRSSSSPSSPPLLLRSVLRSYCALRCCRISSCNKMSRPRREQMTGGIFGLLPTVSLMPETQESGRRQQKHPNLPRKPR